VGLFGYVYDYATVKNVGVIKANITGYSRVGTLVGFLAGNAYNTYAIGVLTGTGQDTSSTPFGAYGGLVGAARSIDQSVIVPINYSFANVNITAYKTAAGGLVGTLVSGMVYNSYAKGNINGQQWDYGGIVGYTNIQPGFGTPKIINSYANENINGLYNMGGIAGEANYYLIVNNAYAIGTLSGSANSIGGIVGNSRGTNVTNSYFAGTASGNDNVGGIIGAGAGPFINNAFSTGVINSNINSGGLQGNSPNLINNSYQ
jgi:hypothetical protein